MSFHDMWTTNRACSYVTSLLDPWSPPPSRNGFEFVIECCGSGLRRLRSLLSDRIRISYNQVDILYIPVPVREGKDK